MRLDYFQLIDRVIELKIPERVIRVEAIVPTESTIFEGHFPGYPLMPGVLLIEAMAQSCGWLVIGLTNFERMPFLIGVKDAKLRTFVQPGARLDITAEMLHEGSGFAVTKARIAAANKPICDAEIRFRLMPFPNAQFRTEMMAFASRIAFPTEALAHG